MIALEDHEGVTTGRSARYRVLRALENPGPGVLAVAHDLLRGSEVVVRIVSQTTEATAARAVSEFHKLIRVEHPSLAQTFDYGRTADGVFYTRELAEHPSLDDTAGRDSRESVVFKCLSGVAAALSELHDAGCVHGLVVPSCIRIEVGKSDRLGGVRLIDAGLRSLLSDAHLEDVRKYDAPEVRAGALPSPAGDAYQLGASLVEAVGGAAALARLRDGKSKPFRSQIRGVDRRLLDLLDDLVAPDPRERPTSREIVEALRSRDWVLPESSRSVASLTSPALIGRDRELAQCDDILERAAKGSAHAVTRRS